MLLVIWGADQMRNAMPLLERLLADAKACLASQNKQEIVAITTRIATEVLGWHVQPDDDRRLWRTEDGKAITIIAENGKRFFVCQHPWVEGVNSLEDCSFNPCFNHARNFIDWEQWVRQAVDGTNSGGAH